MTLYEPIFYDIETTGTNPLAEEWHDGVVRDARVTCIGIGWFKNWRGVDDWEDVEFESKMMLRESEYKLLEMARTELDGIIEDELGGCEPVRTGWNIKKFDDPYIGARYNRYRQSPGFFGHGYLRFDMMKAAADEQFGWNRGYAENDYADVVGVDNPDETTGADMPELFEDGKYDEVKQHCKYDVEVMMEIFWRKREMMMNWFYDYRGIERTASFDETVEL